MNAYTRQTVRAGIEFIWVGNERNEKISLRSMLVSPKSMHCVGLLHVLQVGMLHRLRLTLIDTFMLCL